MKPTKTTLAYLAAMALTILFDLVFGGIMTWVLVQKINGTAFVPNWFFPFCIAGAAINGAFFVLTITWMFLKKR